MRDEGVECREILVNPTKDLANKYSEVVIKILSTQAQIKQDELVNMDIPGIYCINFITHEGDDKSAITTPRIFYIKKDAAGNERELRSLKSVSHYSEFLGSTLKLPTHFTSPFLVIDPGTNDFDRQATTPYGILPGEVLGSNDKIYGFRNIYILNSAGQSQKGESIYESYNGRIEEIPEGSLRKLNFIPKPEDSRWTELVDQDYQYLTSMFNDINKGHIGFGAIENLDQ